MSAVKLKVGILMFAKSDRTDVIDDLFEGSKRLSPFLFHQRMKI